MKNIFTTVCLASLTLVSGIAGEMRGTVRNGNNFQVVSGASVEAVLATSVVARTFTNSSGEYRFFNLPHSFSTYSVRATKGTMKGTNSNCALFLPGRWYWYPAVCNLNVK